MSNKEESKVKQLNLSPEQREKARQRADKHLQTAAGWKDRQAAGRQDDRPKAPQKQRKDTDSAGFIAERDDN